MNEQEFCGRAVVIDGTMVGKRIVTEQGGAPEEKVIIQGVVEGPHKPGLILTYEGTWSLVKRLLSLLGESANGHAKDARRMLCPKDRL